MNRPKISDACLEDYNDTLAAATAANACFGIMSADALHQIVCEVQAWRRRNKDYEYEPYHHTIELKTVYNRV